jgi:hypothetical protein
VFSADWWCGLGVQQADAGAERGAGGLLPGWPFLSLVVAILPIAIACGALSGVSVERPAIRVARR